MKNSSSGEGASNGSITAEPAMLFRHAVPQFLLFALPLAVFAQEDGIQWFDNYKGALAEAKKTGKPIFLEYRCEP
jgi:hypothetical protein